MIGGRKIYRSLVLIVVFVLFLQPAGSAFGDTKEVGAGFSDSGLVNAASVTRKEVPGGVTHPSKAVIHEVLARHEPLPTPDSGIEYTYVRACTAGVGDSLNPAHCPRLNARCNKQESGVLVNWIEVDSTVQPPTRTPTGRSTCMYPGAPPEPPVEGAAAPAEEEAPIVITLEEFQKQPVLAASIISQPLNFGLKNAHSNVYAEATEQEFTFTFRDAAIVLKARPTSYQWSYGDGTVRTTTVPGGPVAGNAFDAQTPTSHQYAQTGDFQVTLTTFFAGDYSVDGGPFQPVAGEAAVVSAPHLMSIWRTKGKSVSENCIENPTGIGCEAPVR